MGIIILKIGLFILAYLLGSIPSGLIVGKAFKGVNLHEEGSKNIGTSNAIRVLGTKLGLLTLVMDVLKTVTVLVLVHYLLPLWIPEFSTIIKYNNYNLNYSIIYGLIAIIGHAYSIFLKFKGGKAVASSFAVVLVITPIAALVGMIFYIVVVLITKYASVGSTLGVLGVILSSTIQFIIQKSLIDNLVICGAYLFMAVLIAFKHIPNYKRLINGTEKKVYLIKKK